ncbi:hypothetical protein MY1884_004951 [Beauveria asiatica]
MRTVVNALNTSVLSSSADSIALGSAPYPSLRAIVIHYCLPAVLFMLIKPSLASFSRVRLDVSTSPRLLHLQVRSTAACCQQQDRCLLKMTKASAT